MFTHRPLRSILGAALAGGVTAFAVASPPAPASAQGLFDFFFGSARRGPPPPSAPMPIRPAGKADPEHRSASGGSGTYCVRLCDGRYFPLPRATGTAAAQLCSSFCPAASTKVFYGGNIDYASASDGTRYSSLPSAFAYRDKIVEGCSCNGRDSYGLATLDVETDPTLRNGDIVATSQGFHGLPRRPCGTPTSRPIDADAKRKLADTKIEPADATPPQMPREGHSLDLGGRRVQLDR